MRIEVYGQPQGKQRARVCMRGGFAKAYTPETTASYENLINLSYIQTRRLRCLLLYIRTQTLL